MQINGDGPTSTFDQKAEELIPKFDDYVKKELRPGELDKTIIKKSGKQVFEWTYFIKMVRSIFFWKSLRFDIIKDHLITGRRHSLFGQATPPEKPNTEVSD